MSYESLLINNLVVVKQPLDKWGEPAGGPTLTPEKCRVETTHRVLRVGKGEELIATALVMLARKPMTVADVRSVLRFGGIDHPVLSIEPCQDGTKIHHYEALVG
jgi:hypothetical protein